MDQAPDKKWGSREMNDEIHALYPDIRCLCLCQSSNHQRTGALLIVPSKQVSGAFERIGVAEVVIDDGWKESVLEHRYIDLA